MIVGIVGLGLIGGSFAKAYHASGVKVFGYDSDQSILDFAILDNIVSAPLTRQNICKCDLILIAIIPTSTISFLQHTAPYIGQHPVVIDCCGTKRNVCKTGFSLANEYGFTFLGGHPMAGSHKHGLKSSRADLFQNAPMVIVPQNFDDIYLLDYVKKLLSPVGFDHLAVTTAEQHDKIISFTSQLAHIVSNAYIKSPTASSHSGFSAGSYKDLTRVAWLDPVMWAELFLENKDNLLIELDNLIYCLTEYRNAINDENQVQLIQLLDDGRRLKEEIDGK